MALRHTAVAVLLGALAASPFVLWRGTAASADEDAPKADKKPNYPKPANADNVKLAWVVGILLAFAAAMLIIAIADRVSSAGADNSGGP